MGRLPTAEEDAAWTPHDNGYEDPGKLKIEVRPRDSYDKHLVVVSLNGTKFTSRFDIDAQFQRSKCREAIISRFGLGEDAHEYIEERLMMGAEAAEESKSLFRPVVTMLDTVTPKPVEWLWPERIAIGKNNLLCGDPGLGKSLLALCVAARVTRDDKYPDGSRSGLGPAGVVILTMEDDAEDTIVPRLLAHNADLSRIGLVSGLTDTDSDGEIIRGIDLAHDIASIRAAIKQVPNCRLVVVDTISDYIGGKTDTHKNRDVRSVMNPLAALANECRVANLCIAHMKKGDGRAIHATMGSIGFVGQARVAWAVTRCPVNAKRRLMTCIKNNLADDTSGLAYTIESHPFNGGPVLAWEAEPVRMSADEAISQLRPQPGAEANGPAVCCRLAIRTIERRTKPAASIYEDADAAGHKVWTSNER